MINVIIQTIIENKEFIEKSLEENIKYGEIILFSKKFRKCVDFVYNLNENDDLLHFLLYVKFLKVFIKDQKIYFFPIHIDSNR